MEPAVQKGHATTDATDATERHAETADKPTSLASPGLVSAMGHGVDIVDAERGDPARVVASDKKLQTGQLDDAERLRRFRRKKNEREAKRKAKKRAARAAQVCAS